MDFKKVSRTTEKNELIRFSNISVSSKNLEVLKKYYLENILNDYGNLNIFIWLGIFLTILAVVYGIIMYNIDVSHLNILLAICPMFVCFIAIIFNLFSHHIRNVMFEDSLTHFQTAIRVITNVKFKGTIDYNNDGIIKTKGKWLLVEIEGSMHGLDANSPILYYDLSEYDCDCIIFILYNKYIYVLENTSSIQDKSVD